MGKNIKCFRVDDMKELEMWCMFGHGRKLALCEKIGCSRQNLEQLIKSSENKRSYKTEMSQVEQDEMFSIEKAKRNMIRAAEHIAHDDLTVQKKAHFELARWADIYADLNKVMK